MIDYVSSNENLNFKEHMFPWSEYFLVKNETSEAVTISSNFSTFAGYKNPIDYLGKTDYDVKCSAAKLAEKFIAQDKKIIHTNNVKTYLMVTTYAEGELSLYLYTKHSAASHIICNLRELKAGVFAQQRHQSIQLIAPKYRDNINKCYEIVDSYANLSVRETQVMHYLIQRKSSTDIGRILKLSNRTIQHYVESIKLKMFCNTTSQLVELGLYLALNEMVPASLVY